MFGNHCKKVLKFQRAAQTMSKTWSLSNQLETHNEGIPVIIPQISIQCFYVRLRKLPLWNHFSKFRECTNTCPLGNAHFWCNYWFILKLGEIIASPADADKSVSILKIAFLQPHSHRLAAGREIGTVPSFAISWHIPVKNDSV